MNIIDILIDLDFESTETEQDIAEVEILEEMEV